MRRDFKTIMMAGATLALLSLTAWGASRAVSPPDAPFEKVASDSSVAESSLRSAMDAIMDNADMGETRALLVMHRGRVVAEYYAPGFGPDSKLLAWSIAKSVTAVLVGLMVSDGRMALDAPVPLGSWDQPGDPRGRITLRQLLTMSSGLDHSEDADRIADADTVRMLFTDGAADMAGFAEGKPLAHAPGAVFSYSTGTSVILSDLMARQLTNSDDPATRQRAMQQFIDGRLKGPVGLSSLTPEYDARGTFIGGSILHMTARDYGRFGELLRNRGRVNGQQVVAESWIDFMLTPSRRNPAYGGHIWLNRASEDSALMPGLAPESLFGCVGHNGQYILVSPRQNLTVVRLGMSPDTEQRAALRAGLAKLIALFPG